MHHSVSFFFFQAEDGIRDLTVTGVQTCALPISGCGNVIAIVRPLGCVRLKGGFALGVLWRLWRRRSLFRKSIRPPAATTTTRGVNIHSRWSTAVAGGGASAVGPGGGVSSQTTAVRIPRRRH